MNITKTLFLQVALVLFALTSNGQLYNNGATIKIQPGAYVFVGGDAINNNAGTISNDGKLEVQGSFTNSATYNSATADDSLLLTGGGNVTLNGGTSTINYLTINKTDNTNNVTLTGSTLLGIKLDYNSGNFTTDPINNPSYVFSAPVSAVFNFTADQEIAGNVKRTSWVNGTPVMFNQTNMLVKTNVGTAPTDFTVTMIPQNAGGDPTQAEREVKRRFQFSNTGGTDFTADISFPYLTSELNTNVESNLVPWDLLSAEWNGRLTPITRDAVGHFVSTTGITASELANEWKLADSKYTFTAVAFLRGAWNGISAMNTTLNSNGIIPGDQPYNTTPFNYNGTESVTAMPNANVVDWVLVELRKPSTGLAQDASSSTIIGRKAGFLLNNGSVVDLDGINPISFDINKQGTSFIVVRHRNHLGVISNQLASNSSGTFANDFSLLANNYKPVGASSDPEGLLTGGGSKYGMWPGDANKSGSVNTNDINAIKISAAASATGYLFTDVNLSNSINTNDINLTKIVTAASGTGAVTSGTVVSKPVIIKTNIPDPVDINN